MATRASLMATALVVVEAPVDVPVVFAGSPACEVLAAARAAPWREWVPPPKITTAPTPTAATARRTATSLTTGTRPEAGLLDCGAEGGSIGLGGTTGFTGAHAGDSWGLGPSDATEWPSGAAPPKRSGFCAPAVCDGTFCALNAFPHFGQNAAPSLAWAPHRPQKFLRLGPGLPMDGLDVTGDAGLL